MVPLAILMPALATASPRAELAGVVLHVDSQWTPEGDTIVSALAVRRNDGSVIRASVLGGTAGGFTVAYSHVRAIPVEGTRVELVGRAAADGTFLVDEIGLAAPHEPVLADAVGGATYGVRRTVASDVPVRPRSCLRVVFDQAGTTHLADDTAHTVLDAAFATWTDAASACGALTFARSVAPTGAPANDGVVTVRFREDSWCRPASPGGAELCYPTGAAAITRLIWIDDPEDPDDGTIVDADVELDAVHFAFAVDGVSLSNHVPRVDLASVATHEIGHVLGLTHNCWEGIGDLPRDLEGRSVPACDDVEPGSPAALATMFPSIDGDETHKQTLEDGDRAAACEVVTAGRCDGAEVVGGCNAGRGSHLWGTLVGLFVVAWVVIRPASRIRTDDTVRAVGCRRPTRFSSRSAAGPRGSSSRRADR